jgi:prepilin-type processing-associated H-X9-DG protein
MISLAGTNYLGVTGTNAEARDGLFTSDRKRRLADVRDGASNTLMVGERGFRAGALEVIDTGADIDNLRFGNWFSAIGQRNGSVGIVLGVREINYNFNTNQRALPWEKTCPPGPYHFGPPGRTVDSTGAINETCDLFQYWSYHHGGGNFMYADGSVHFFTYPKDNVLPALATRGGGEEVSP